MQSFQVTKTTEIEVRYMSINGWGSVFWTKKPSSLGATSIKDIELLAKGQGEVTIKNITNREYKND
jgi:hypothetical protein